MFQMIAAADKYIRSGKHKEATEMRMDKMTGEWVAKPVHGRAARRSFMIGFSDAVTRRLRRAKQEVTEEAITNSDSTAVAVRNKELEVIDYYSANSTAGRGSYKGASHASSVGAYSTGHDHGNRARIGSSPALSGGRKALS